MTILDVQPFHEGIQWNILMLQRLCDEMVARQIKSSATAPLTKNQTKGFPELQSDGGSVVGKGIFKGGTTIPPTKVEVIRPD